MKTKLSRWLLNCAMWLLLSSALPTHAFYSSSTANVSIARIPGSFTYDFMGRRVSKQVETWTNSAYSTIVSNKFVYDGWNLVAELNGTNNTAIRTYLWGMDLSGSMQGAGGVGGLLAVKDTVNATHFAAYDGNGNVTGLFSAADGTSSAVYEYDPFGNLLRATGLMAKVNPFRFSTKYQDDETDWSYYGYRFYNAMVGRWLSRDPIEESGGRNLFCTLRNDPVDRLDILGLKENIKVTYGEFVVDMEASRATVTGAITFKPKNCPTCKFVKLVQVVQVSRAGKQLKWMGKEANREKVKTKADSSKGIEEGWFVDHLAANCKSGDKACSIYYRDSWSNKGQSHDGSDTAEASLWDSAGDSGLTYNFETCARCVDNSHYFGCVTWGWSTSSSFFPRVTFKSFSGADSPSATFNSAIAAFNSFYGTSN